MATIPPDLLPHADQYPPFVMTDEQRARFDLCFAVTRLVAQWDDPIFCRQLYFSDMATGDLASLPDPQQEAQG